MLRSVAVIASAIALCAPRMPAPARTAYAAVLRAEARDHGFDPLTAVALIWHESGWKAGSVSADGEDYGLAQIRARHLPACRNDADPVRRPSAACERAKAALLDGATSIRIMARQITTWRDLCRTKTGRPALLHRWLQGYGGYSSPQKGVWCGQQKSRGRWRDLPQPKAVRSIIRCRRQLLRSRPCRRRSP